MEWQRKEMRREKRDGQWRMVDDIGEFVLASPPIPQDKATFLNQWGARTADQKFEHTKLPTKAEYESWPKHKQQELEAQEWGRRDNGVWFWNCGVATYITGRHYFYLNYHRYGKEKPDYREAGRRFYWWWEHVMDSPNCLGGYLHTRRRDGKTSRFASIGVEGATGVPFFRFAIQSKNEDSAEKTVYQKEVLPAVNALKDCPWFMPETAGSSRPKREILFDTPVKQGRGAGNTPDRVKGLGSIIFWAESTENAVDGDGVTFHLNDEVGKKQRFNSYARWSVVSKQFEPDGYVVGKGANTTTSDEDDDDSVEMCQTFWNNSDQTKLGPNGIDPDNPLRRTASGLFRYCPPAYEGMLCDAYGRDTQAGLDHFLRRRAAVAHDPILLLREKRANPFTIEEALTPSIKADCIFNQQHIGECQQAIAEHDAMHTNPLVKRYRLYWTDATRTEVACTEDANGRFYMSWLPPAEWLNQVQQVGYITTKLGEVPRMKPKAAHRFGASADPFDARTTEKAGSKGAMHGMYNYDANMEARRDEYGYWPSHSFFMEYAERPDNPEVYYEDAVMFVHWAGCMMYRETQKDNIGEYLIARGYGDFLSRAPVATLSDYQKNNGKKTGSASTPMLIQQYSAAKVVFYQKFVGGPMSKDSPDNPHGPGYNDDGVPYDFRRMPFVRTMNQDISFDPNEDNVRKKSDLSVSHGFGLIQATGFILRPRQASTKGLTMKAVRGSLSMYR